MDSLPSEPWTQTLQALGDFKIIPKLAKDNHRAGVGVGFGIGFVLPMRDIRNQFRDFLLRLADNDLHADDWNTYAVQHYLDEEIERIRRAIVERSLDFPDWQVGWIPRDFQDTARGLAECLRELDEDSI